MNMFCFLFLLGEGFSIAFGRKKRSASAVQFVTLLRLGFRFPCNLYHITDQIQLRFNLYAEKLTEVISIQDSLRFIVEN